MNSLITSYFTDQRKCNECLANLDPDELKFVNRIRNKYFRVSFCRFKMNLFISALGTKFPPVIESSIYNP